MVLDLITAAVIVIIALIGILVLIKIGGLLLRILIHVILGWIFLVIVNLLPFIDIPINIITVLIAGIGGVFGVILLIIAQLLGLF
jgi:inhibitor of the pro-sigma K processing machinery